MYQCRPGWTPESMIEVIESNMLDHKAWAGGVCKYRTPDGNKCAVGCFLSDEQYDSLNPNERGSYYPGMVKSRPDIETSMPLDPVGMVRLQHAHDWNLDGGPRPILREWIESNVQA